MFDIALLIWVVPGTAGLWFYNRFTARQYYQLEGWEYLFAVMFFATPYYFLMIIFPEQTLFYAFLKLFLSFFIFSPALGFLAAKVRTYKSFGFHALTHSTFHNCCYSWYRKPVFVTLSNRKVYVGLLVDYTKSSRIEPAIKIAPVISGYRDEYGKVHWTDRYPVFSKEELEKEAGLIMPYSQIINFSLWSLSTAYEDAPRIDRAGDQTATKS